MENIEIVKYAICMIYDFGWTLYYGKAAEVEKLLFAYTGDGHAFNRRYETKERMDKQLEYFRNELDDPKIHRIEDIRLGIA